MLREGGGHVKARKGVWSCSGEGQVDVKVRSVVMLREGVWSCSGEGQVDVKVRGVVMLRQGS